MNANPAIETISLIGFVAALVIGAFGQTPAFDTASAVLFVAAGGLFTSELWWSSKPIPERKR